MDFAEAVFFIENRRRKRALGIRIGFHAVDNLAIIKSRRLPPFCRFSGSGGKYRFLYIGIGSKGAKT